MKVYLLAAYDNSTAKELWIGRYGVHGELKHGFSPIEDADGNLICGLADGENLQFSFADEIKSCSQIDYNPKTRQRT